MGLPRAVVVLCAVCIFICYCDRVNISVCVIAMGEHYGWDKLVQSKVLGSFYSGYVCSQLLGAWLSVRFGGREVLAVATVVWSLLTFLTPSAADLGMSTLLTCRVCLGVAEGMAFPCVFHIFSDSDSARRSRNVGMVQTGSFAGTVFAFLISTWMVQAGLWRHVFHMFGLAGLGWFAAWWYVALKPRQSTATMSVSGSTSKMMLGHHDDPVVTLSFSLLWKLLTKRPFQAIYVAHFCHAWAHFTVLAWLPTYLHDLGKSDAASGGDGASAAGTDADASSDSESGLSGLILIVPYILMAVVSVVSAQAADVLLVQGYSRAFVRKLMSCIGFLGAASLLVLFSLLPPGNFALTILCLALGISAAVSAGHEANKLDVAPAGYSGLLQGVSNTLAAGSGLIGVPVAAYIFLWTGSWTSVFLLIAAIFTTGAVCFGLGAKGTTVPLA
eukprot:m.176913 g.176913  ORF g.176913 m.176913 type:complete len:442 (+) comp17956_c0_seq5:275-1600(+)